MRKNAARLTAFQRVGTDANARKALLAFGLFSVAEFGIWVTILVYAYSAGGADWVGGAAVVQLVPAAVLAPFLASRLGRLGPTTALVVAYGAQTACLVATAVAAAVDASAVLTIGLATLTNVAISAGRPAHNSFLPALAEDPATLTAANVATTSLESVGVFAGPAVAGAALALMPPAGALAIFAICLGAGTVLASRVRGSWTPTDTPHVADVGEQANLRSNTSAKAALGLTAVQQFAIGALDVLIVVLAIEVLGSGEAGAANLTALMGAGGVLGGLLATSMVGRERMMPALAVGVSLRSGSLVAMGWIPLAGLLLAMVGVGYTVVDVATRTLIQRVTHGAVLARAFGYLEGLTMAGLALGALAAPPLIDAFGVERTFPVIGLALPAALAIAWQPLSRADRLATIPHDRIAAIKDLDTFAGLDPPALEALARSAAIMAFEPGDIIVSEGDRGDRMWAVVSGSVGVSRRGVAITDLHAGSVFGEIALVSDRPRIATVRALEPLRVLEIPRAGFLEALATSSTMRSTFADITSRRTAETLEGGS